MAAGWSSSQQVDDGSALVGTWSNMASVAALLLQRRYPQQQDHARNACIDGRENTPDRFRKTANHRYPRSVILIADN